ncbi:saccharopine dehydrogenase NADP-binding domain-containing protein [Bacteroidales bacterium AH-315-I05]|nr:saccharopine dehydrogenase NADP-binding domain-containing protein [Bacteroidales bacterium AH-315-I05]
MKDPFVIYGATGYTGQLMAEMAVAQGLSPILSGRNVEKLRAVAEPLGLEYRAVSLDDKTGLEALLADASLVLHIAGPFSATAQPMVAACLATQTHYLDITGEIDIFERHYTLNEEAINAGIMIMSGVGFDVVPTDCLAAHIKQRLSDATELNISIDGGGSLSPGTAKTAMESIGRRTLARRGGQLTELSRHLYGKADFGRGERTTIAMSWGDVSTAYRTTSIPDITVYFKLTPVLKKLMGLPMWMRKVMGSPVPQQFIKRQIEKHITGPSSEQRAKGFTFIIAEAVNAKGEKATSTLQTPDGYTFTCTCGLAITQRVLQGDCQAGFQTPGGMYGPDLILPFEGVKRTDILRPLAEGLPQAIITEK